MAVGIRPFTARTSDGGGGPVLDADNGEQLMHVQPGVSIALADRPAEYPGTLYITSKQLVWLSDPDTEKGYAVDFYSLSLHAVSRDPEAYPSPCIYAQIEIEADEDESEESDALGSGILELSKVTEMRLIPPDASQLDILFQVFCTCAELNPETIEEEGETHGWVYSADQMENEAEDIEDTEWHYSHNATNTIGHSNGEHDLARTVLELQINDERFEDAEEPEHVNESGQR